MFVECKWNFTQPSGAFASPYFPDNYHDFQDCEWNITAPKGYVIQLRFGVFELESNPHSCGNGRCSCDYVEVKEESVTGDVTTLGRYCMTIMPLPILQSSTNKMIVTFYSDHVISAKGFNASYDSVPATFKGIVSLHVNSWCYIFSLTGIRNVIAIHVSYGYTVLCIMNVEALF